MRAFRHDVVAVAVATREGLLSPNSVCSMGSANVLFQADRSVDQKTATGSFGSGPPVSALDKRSLGATAPSAYRNVSSTFASGHPVRAVAEP